jgi:hypothetical protein
MANIPEQRELSKSIGGAMPIIAGVGATLVLLIASLISTAGVRSAARGAID